MTKIELTTIIQAPIELCFNLSRDIDIHQGSTANTREKAIAGRTSGLCEKGDTVTWRARHFGIYQKLTVEITEMIFPTRFEDKMLKGAFKSMYHIHTFSSSGNATEMKDDFRYEVPFGLAGALFNALVLKSYMTRFLLQRNHFIKTEAEMRAKKP